MELLEFLRSQHRLAPFLFYNGNTFAAIARSITGVVCGELPDGRRKTIVSAVAHYVAGVLDRESMLEISASLFTAMDFSVGDKVQTLKGTMHGVVVGFMEDGRIIWRPDGLSATVTALPESLKRV